MQLNYRDSKPIYEQIKEGIRRMIVMNVIKQDEKLPSVRVLACKYAINPNTIAKAYRELEEEGYLYTKSGKGTFVADAKTARQSLTRNLKILFDQVVTELFVLETPVEELRTRMDDAKEQLSMEDDLVRFVTQDMQTEDVVTEGNDDTDNLVKKFDDFTALDGVNMNVEKGAVYGLVGPNGAGKSTLIRHITGVMRQDAGEVFIEGEPVYENARIKGHMAYIPDDMFYFLQSDTINMMHYYKGMYPNFDEKQFYRMQEFFPSIDVKRNIRKLSKGMQKQVAFWLALCCKPKLIVLDEPVDGLDPVMRRQIWSIMLDDVAVNNTTVVVSSHNLRELEDVCDHVGILNNGKIMIERSLTELQGNISKIQIACPYGMPKIPQNFKVLHMSNIGRVYTVIVRGEPDAITDGKDSPQVVDVLPLTLEEIFIYEMGGEDYEVKDIIY